MNPWLLLAAVGACVGAFFYGQHVGEQGAEAAKAREERIGRVAYEAGQKGAAAAIAEIKPQNVTILQELEREIRTNTIYRDCRVPADGVRLVNDAITGRTKPAGGGELPRAGPAEAGP
ncbi:MAG: hypothetical protein IBJ14_05085 [Hydrogenophaga sp.]|nr:hypothetical protein [Hydrogenophaga sp.]